MLYVRIRHFFTVHFILSKSYICSRVSVLCLLGGNMSGLTCKIRSSCGLRTLCTYHDRFCRCWTNKVNARIIAVGCRLFLVNVLLVNECYHCIRPATRPPGKFLGSSCLETRELRTDSSKRCTAFHLRGNRIENTSMFLTLIVCA